MNEDRHDGNGSNGTRRPAQIMAEINRTRDEMDRTLHAIEDRLTPGQLVDQGLDYLKNSGAREYASNLGSSVKTNPLPATLAGIGIAWMMAVGNRPAQDRWTSQGSGSSGSGIGERMKSAKDSLTGSMQSTKDSLSGGMQSTKDSVGGKMQSTKDSLTGSMQSAKDTVSGSMQSAKDSLTGTMQSAKGSLQSAKERASQLGQSARGGWDSMLNEHPLALGAIGLAIGAVAAAMVPRTRKEDEIMGEARDGLVEQAKQAGGEKLEQAKQVAASAKDKVVAEAQNRGLAPQQGADNTTKPAQPQASQSKPAQPQGGQSKPAQAASNPKPAQGAPVTASSTTTPAAKPDGTSNPKPRAGEPPDPLKWPGSRG